ncbi:BTB/POZ domain-containing protein At1g67900-like [Chenopodium quinoa]|uniref:NPH3 domain-containing protein n=1 Tax=Chenopodium quinoa TaxID=63459 RepID=A0A803M751_CHEQI|nr:BTB/POZ domain-containing protein At1g67900-like [Chenopodium quinoa]
MKFMKLGSKPDTFYTAEAVRSVSSEVSSDLIIQVQGHRYLLHKFPLLSKCLRLQKLCAESPESSPRQIIQLPDFPGGIESFELCAKFCYGITITLSAYNIIATRCAAEYLQMTEEAEKGNLIYKLEVFLNSCILQGWKDAIVTLQSTKAFPSWSEDLGITSRCIEAIAARVLTHPTKINLSRTYSRRAGGGVGGGRDDIVSCNGANGDGGGSECARQKNISKGWWAEDVAELGIDLYWRTMIAVKSGGRVPSHLIGEALQIYASKWLPTKQVIPDIDSDKTGEKTSKYRLLLESIVSLLPSEKGAVSCSFLLKLLKAANLLKASPSSKMELARRVGIQMDEANVKDLLIPSLVSETRYDVDIFMAILEQFLSQGQSPPTSPPRTKGRYERRRRSRSAENIDIDFQERRRSSSASHSSKLKVAKVVDKYLQEIARDTNLPLSKMVAIAEAIPSFARIEHDDLYKAIDIYLKAHPELTKSERKRLCRVLDCKKLSVEACMHAAQNELLPLRVVVQVLFFEQARAAMAGGKVTDLPPDIKALLAAQDDHSSRPPAALSTTTTIPGTEDQWSVSGLKSPKSKLSTLKMKLAEDDLEENGIAKGLKFKNLCSIPTRPKRMFSKLLSINNNRSVAEKN